MQLDSSFVMNSIILISSDRVGEEGQTRRLSEDLESIATSSNNIMHYHYSVSEISDVDEIIDFIKSQIISDNIKPILHFHMHGDKDKGLQFGSSGEFISWEYLTRRLREINIILQNNLCIISTACFGFHAIREIKITQQAPFFCLIAPQYQVDFGFVDDNISIFYTSLIEKSSIDKAYGILKSKFDYFHCEKLLVITLAKYINEHCVGKGKATRVERLITEAVAQGKPSDSNSLKIMRKYLKDHLKPNQNLLDKYARSFLMNKDISVDMNQILELTKSKRA